MQLGFFPSFSSSSFQNNQRKRGGGETAYYDDDDVIHIRTLRFLRVPLDDIFVERVQSNGFGTVNIEPPVANAVDIVPRRDELHGTRRGKKNE